MLRIVLPFVTALIDSVSTLHVVNTVTTVNIGIAIEVVVPVDIDIVVSPAAVPAPTAAPGYPDRDACAEPDISSTVISVWWVIHIADMGKTIAPQTTTGLYDGT